MEEEIYQRRGRIFDVQRYSIHDGPGIRTILFLKGCFLRCRWCCNPESQSYEIQQMTLGGKTKTVGRDVTVRELIDEAAMDRIYFERSGGGITLSGGECLAQPEFTEGILRAAHEYGITTAIETTGFAPREVLDRVIPHVDYVLMDVKHMDCGKHAAFTGKPNDQILANAKYIASIARSLTIRTPVIPNFNDTPAEIAAISRFAASLPGVTEHHLLPYHRLGQDKYAGIGRNYTLSHLVPPSESEMQRLKAAAESAAPKLKIQIGG